MRRFRAGSGLVSTALIAGSVSAVVFAAPSYAASCTNSYQGPNTGSQSWFTAANWTNGVPTSSDDVCIAKNGTYTVDLTNSATVNSVTVGGTGGTQTLQIDGSGGSVQLNVAASTTNTVTAHGAIALTPSANGYALFAGGSGAQLNNNGTFSTSGAGNPAYLRITLTNRAGGTTTIAAPDTRQDSTTSTTNSGTLTVASGGGYALSGSSNFAQATGTLVVNGTYSQNSGTFTASGGTESGNPVILAGTTITDGSMTGAIDVQGGSTLVGSIPVGQTLTVDGQATSVFLSVSGSSTVRGTLAITPAANGYAGINNAGSGAITVASGGTLSTSGTGNPAYLRVPITNQSGGTFTLAATDDRLDNGDAVTNAGAMTIASGATLSVTSSPTVTQSAGSLVVNGSYVQNSGTFVASGGTESGNAVQLTGASLTDSTTGTTGAFRFLSSGGLTGDIPVGQSVTADSSNGSVFVSVAGTTTLRGTLDLHSTANGYTVLSDGGSGTITVASGATFSSSGAADAQLTFVRVPFTNQAGGTVDFESPSVLDDNNTNITNSGAFTVGSGTTLSVTGGQTVTQSAGTMGVQGTFNDNSGTFVAAGGTLTGTAIGLGNTTLSDNASGTPGAFRFVGGGTITGDIPTGQSVTVDSTSGSLSVGVSGSSTVHGTLTVHPTSGSYAVLGDAGSGSVTVASGGTLSISGPSDAAPAYLRLPVTVQSGGTLTDTAPTTNQDSSTATINSGVATFGDDAHLSLGGGATFTNTGTGTLGVTVNATTATASGLNGGAVSLDGTLAVQTIGSPTLGDTYQPISSTVTGTFATLEFGPHGYTVAYASNSVTLTVADVFTVTATPFTANKKIPTGPVQVATIGTATAGTGTYSATVDWGDGKPVSAATVTITGATGTVTAPSHTYSTSGAFTVTTTVHNTDGTTLSASTTVVVPVTTVTAVTPKKGYTTGGTSVTITGTGLTGATAVVFGSTPATSFTVVNDSTITAVSPAHAAGIVNVQVTTPGGTSAATAPSRYTYVIPPPTVSSVTPGTGPLAGGAAVVITGTFLGGATAVTFGTANAASFTVVSDTEIDAITPAGTAVGAVSVKVTTPSGTSPAAAGARYTYAAAPVITSLSPTSGPSAGGTHVTITGTGFDGVTAVAFGSTPATSFTVVNSHTIRAVSPGGADGAVNVRVTAVGGTSATGAAVRYTYVAAPTITSITPTSGPLSGGTHVTITGTGFDTVTAVAFGTTAATSFTVVNSHSIRAVSPAGDPGAVSIRITALGGTSAAGPPAVFTYVLAPTVTSLTPSSGPTAGGTTVTIIGTKFGGTTAVSFGGTPATSFTLTGTTKIVAIAPAHAAGVAAVRVTAAGGVSPSTTASRFTYS